MITNIISLENKWQNLLDIDVNWHLSFSQYKESERTKHVHRIHPYKGKFIPQLVEYFIDSHTDDFKKDVYFHKGDIILDPFCGSGTTMVQSNELGMHAIGIDISSFNVLISRVKVEKHDLNLIEKTIYDLTLKLKNFQNSENIIVFDNHLSKELSKFNNKYFPSREFKKNIVEGKIKEIEYAKEKEEEFIFIYNDLIHKYKIKILNDNKETFLDKWFLEPIRKDLYFLAQEIKKINNEDVKNVLMVILSRIARSCRATTHSDLATLKEPVITPYYCKKHMKICKPIFSITKWYDYYTADTLNRLKFFDKLRTDAFRVHLSGDSRNIDIYEEVKKKNDMFAKMLLKQKIKGIFSSPPYIGLINYHEQHAYAYDLFGFERNDNLEIGPLFKGNGKKQREFYIKDISQVLINCKKYLADDYDVFLVVNDKFNLYPKIAELAGMRIIKEYKRPVLYRAEKNNGTPYCESIIHLKERKI